MHSFALPPELSLDVKPDHQCIRKVLAILED